MSACSLCTQAVTGKNESASHQLNKCDLTTCFRGPDHRALIPSKSFLCSILPGPSWRRKVSEENKTTVCIKCSMRRRRRAEVEENSRGTGACAYLNHIREKKIKNILWFFFWRTSFGSFVRSDGTLLFWFQHLRQQLLRFTHLRQWVA